MVAHLAIRSIADKGNRDRLLVNIQTHGHGARLGSRLPQPMPCCLKGQRRGSARRARNPLCRGGRPRESSNSGQIMSKLRRTLYIDMDNVLVDFSSAFPHLSEQDHLDFADRLDEVPGIFSKMLPLQGSVEAFQELSGLFDTYILSTAPWENPSAWSDKLVWVKKNLGQPAYKRLILSHHKNLNSGDFLVDDRTKNGADRFPGQHLHFGTAEFPDWPTVTAYLKQHTT